MKLTLESVRVLPALALLAGLTAWAPAARATWRTFGLASGLPSLNAQAVLEDHSGSLWFGTDAGVARYDGVVWRTFTTSDTLVSNRVATITEDRAGNLWFGTDGGVSRYQPVSRQWRSYTRANTNLGLVSDDVRAAIQDRAGVLWFATGGGVSRYDPMNDAWQSFTIATTGGGLRSNSVLAIAEDAAGTLWFGTAGGGASRFHPDSLPQWRVYTPSNTANGLPSSTVPAVYAGPGGAIWFGTDTGGLSRLLGSRWTNFVFPFLFGISSLTGDVDGNLWVGGAGGVSRFDGDIWRAYSHADGLVSDAVRALRFDGSGNLWVGTNRGVSLYDRVSWHPLAGLGSSVLAACRDSTGVLWLGTDGAGAARVHGDTLALYRLGQGPASGVVQAIAADSAGALWFGTDNGVSRYDGTTWSTFDTSSGLAAQDVRAVLVDRSNRVWFGTSAGLNVYDGVAWRSFTHGDSELADVDLHSLMMDHVGRIWVGGAAGVSVWDGVGWSAYTTVSTSGGLPAGAVHALREDRLDRLWFGTENGLGLLEGNVWRTAALPAPGPAGWPVRTILEDHRGVLWVGTFGTGVFRYDESAWHRFTTDDGLPNNVVQAILGEPSGDVWFGTGGGAVRQEPDRVAPQTVVSPSPPRLSASRLQTFHFAAGFGETDGISFQHALDGVWSSWSADPFWVAESLADTLHQFVVRARDAMGNIDPSPDTVWIEIDSTPPEPLVISPSFGQPVRDSIAIVGTVADKRFVSYRVDVRPVGAVSWDAAPAQRLAQSATAVTAGVLATWATATVPDGPYELRVAVTDVLGLTGVVQVDVVVDNHAPYAGVTTPARVSAELGGDVYTTNADVHLYMPPHAFIEDAIVLIIPVVEAGSDVLPNGARRVTEVDSIGWGTARLVKLATMERSFEASSSSDSAIALYGAVGGGAWQRIGGTVNAGPRRVSAPLSGPGRYAVYVEPTAPVGPRVLTAMSLTPRVFSPSGGFASRDIAIGFSLGRPGAVSVRIFNRAGRLVREIARSQPMGAGANLVRWDGRTREGEIAVDGMYLVTVEALGQRLEKTLAIVQ